MTSTVSQNETEQLKLLDSFNFKTSTPVDQLYSNGAAEAYEKCFASQGIVGWHSPNKIAETCIELDIPPSAQILDLGCGTGFVANALVNKGFRNITGMDASDEMLGIAREKQLYANTRKVIIENKDSIPSEYHGRYDLVCSAGFVGGPTHGLQDTYEAHLVCAKIGGYCIFTTDQFYKPDSFKEKREKLAAEGDWELVREELVTKYDTVAKKHGKAGNYQDVKFDVFSVYKRIK